MEELKDILTDMDDTKELYEQGVLFIDGEFDTELANKFRTQYLNCIRNNMKKIVIFINSPGGNLYDFLSIYGLIKATPMVHIETIINGYAFSAGAYLALLGDVRRATEGSRIMFHEMSGGNDGKLNEMILDIKESKTLQRLLTKIIKKTTKIDQYHDINEWLQKDQYFGINEAYKLGVLTSRNCELEIISSEIEK